MPLQPFEPFFVTLKKKMRTPKRPPVSIRKSAETRKCQLLPGMDSNEGILASGWFAAKIHHPKIISLRYVSLIFQFPIYSDYIWNLWNPRQATISGNETRPPGSKYIGNWKMRAWWLTKRQKNTWCCIFFCVSCHKQRHLTYCWWKKSCIT